MTLKKFKDEAEALIAKLYTLTSYNLQDNGDKEDSCQRVSITNALNHLQATVNGVVDSDMKGGPNS